MMPARSAAAAVKAAASLLPESDEDDSDDEEDSTDDLYVRQPSVPMVIAEPSKSHVAVGTPCAVDKRRRLSTKTTCVVAEVASTSKATPSVETPVMEPWIRVSALLSVALPSSWGKAHPFPANSMLLT